MEKKIQFSPPDLTQEEIDEVVDTLKSGWITTGPKVKLLEDQLAEFCQVNRVAALNSATAAMELTLRLLEVGPGDEVITTPYTYTSTASVIEHVGAKIVFVDTAPNSFEMDYNQLEKAITHKTKVIMPVDFAGVPCDYDRLFEALEKKKALYSPKESTLQTYFDRAIVLADAAHSLGATYKNQPVGSIADFTCFSFHAVKNITTAEGGAVAWRSIDGISDEDIYRQYMLYSLHGQTKDALAKTKTGNWEYDIEGTYYKCNMTDIMASIGLVQLRRYQTLLAKRHELVAAYESLLESLPVIVLPHHSDNYQSSAHLMVIRLNDYSVEQRNHLIQQLASRDIPTNVHFKPLPLLTAYQKLGFDIKDYPNANRMYEQELTLPLHTLLTREDIDYICQTLSSIVRPHSKKAIEKKKKVLILGVSAVQDDAIQCLKKMGCETHAIAMAKDGPGAYRADYFECINILNTERIVRYITQHKIDYIYSTGSDLAIPVAMEISERLGLPHFISEETARITNNKDQMRKVLGEDFIGNIPYQCLSSIEDQRYLDFPFILKPTDSQGQRGVCIINNETEFIESFERVKKYSRSGKVIIEKIINGPELSINGYVVNGELVFCLPSDRVTWPQYIGLIHKHQVPSRVLNDLASERVRQMMKQLVKRLSINNGPIYVQAKIEDDHPYVIEVTPRLDGCHMWKLIKHYLGLDLMQLTFDHLLFNDTSQLNTLSHPQQAMELTFICQEPNTPANYYPYKEQLANAIEGECYYEQNQSIRPINGKYEKIGYTINALKD